MKAQKPKPKPNHRLEKFLYKTKKNPTLPLIQTPSPSVTSSQSTCNIIPASKKHFVEFGKVSHMSPDTKAVLDAFGCKERSNMKWVKGGVGCECNNVRIYLLIF